MSHPKNLETSKGASRNQHLPMEIPKKTLWGGSMTLRAGQTAVEFRKGLFFKEGIQAKRHPAMTGLEQNSLLQNSSLGSLNKYQSLGQVRSNTSLRLV